MEVELKVPSVGESITEVQIAEWLKKPGDAVEQDENIAVLESEKATVELPAPASGVLLKVMKGPGERANVNEVIGIIDEGAKAKTGEAKPAKGKEDRKGTKEVVGKKTRDASESSSADKASERDSAQTKAAQAEDRQKQVDVSASQTSSRVMPSAKRALAERGLSADQVEASGPGGRLLKEDVYGHREPPVTPEGEAVQPVSASGERLEEVVPMSLLRQRIAERLVMAQQTGALLTTFNEVDMSAIMSLRKSHQDLFVKKYEVKLGFMSFFVKAIIEALKEYPQLNAEVRGNSIVYKNFYDIGVAIGGGRGLVVPVLRNAERMSFAEIEMAIGEFAKRAQTGKLTLEELQGGTFTITNGGVYGSMLSTPIVNPPQSGVLGMHAIQDRPVVRNGEIVIRPMMFLALTYDHRLVDGREAVSFLKRVKDCIEDPARIILEV